MNLRDIVHSTFHIATMGSQDQKRGMQQSTLSCPLMQIKNASVLDNRHSSKMKFIYIVRRPISPTMSPVWQETQRYVMWYKLDVLTPLKRPISSCTRFPVLGNMLPLRIA